MKYKSWAVLPPCPEVQARLEAAGLSSLLSAVLAARGVDTPEQARHLLCAREEPLHDPMCMKDMDRAVARLRLALERDEQIAVYGDYDVDGITSTCLMTEFLQTMGGRAIPYIPDRLEEGYGLNREAISVLAGRGVSLLVTVDCGITAVEEVDYAKGLGMDVIITDHHACKDQLPCASAVVDPHRFDCSYPFQGLAGVGVALKLAMATAGPEKAGQVFHAFCDLAAVGTVADVMPMTGENRAIVSLGLQGLSPPRRLGFAKLIQCAGAEDKPVTCATVGYMLAPRINASGRMGCTDVALELLLTRDSDRAEALAQELSALNRERQCVGEDIFQQCVQRLSRDPASGVIVLSGYDWHQGVVGVVASRLAEKYGCPVFMICLDHGMGKGSCRSWGGINLFELLKTCSPLLENYGGHALAAGFTVREENICALALALHRAAAECGADTPPTLELALDAQITAEQLTASAVASLELLEPCGTGNPRPVLALCGAQVQSLTHVGRGRHLKLRLESRGHSLDAIWFSPGETPAELEVGRRVDVAFYPQINEFRGERTVQLQVLDLRPAPSRAELEHAIYEKFSRGDTLSVTEASLLLPDRTDFVGLWRWLERQSAANTVVEDTLHRIARGASRAAGHRELPARTLLCLEILQERGLIELSRRTDRLRIVVRRDVDKVDLDGSFILRRLKEAAQT